MKRSKFFFIMGLMLYSLFAVSLIQAKVNVNKNPYSYLPKPPVSLDFVVSPDKAVYERGDIISFDILARLDTLRCDPICDYRVYFGNLSGMLAQSELIGSTVKNYYTLTITNHAVLISFKVKMLNKYSPPYIEVKTVREAPGYATAKKQFQNIVIDQFATFYITSPQYAKVRSSGYGSTDY